MRIEVFPGKKGGWFWHKRSKGRITADAQKFLSRSHAVRASKAEVRATLKCCGAVPRFEQKVRADGVLEITWQ